MSKEVLFRGKTCDTKEWKEGYYYKGNLADVPLCLADCRIHHCIIETGTIWYCDAETIGQYIVTEDYQKIFENDIIDEYKHEFFVRRFVAKDIRTFTREYDKSGHDSIWIVVGNIHDNKELLDGVK